MKILKTILIIVLITFSFKAFASMMILESSKSEIGLHEQFYVDLLLDPETVSINGIEGNITFPEEYLSFIRSEEGKSMVSLWVQPPQLFNNTVRFTGIIPNGFDGVIDPFNQEHKRPGLIVRFVFEAIRSGQISITTPPFTISLNDGKGTIKNIPAVNISIFVNNRENHVIYENNNSDISPELEAYIIKTPNLFDNKYALIFKAIDRSSGIREVMIKEGNKDWKKITSPYLLEDQTRHSIIALQAVNHSGSSVIITIDPIEYKFTLVDYALLIVFIVILFLIIKKRYVNKNKK